VRVRVSDGVCVLLYVRVSDIPRVVSHSYTDPPIRSTHIITCRLIVGTQRTLITTTRHMHPRCLHSFEELKTHLSVIIIFMHSLFFSQDRVIGFEFLFQSKSTVNSRFTRFAGEGLAWVFCESARPAMAAARRISCVVRLGEFIGVAIASVAGRMGKIRSSCITSSMPTQFL
jgi:hypothetical protein